MITTRTNFGTVFIHHGDCLGPVTIRRYVGEGFLELVVPGSDIQEFVAEFIRGCELTDLENANWQDLLIKRR